MRKYIRKIAVLASAGCVFLSGCSHTYLGVPGMLYDYTEEFANYEEEVNDMPSTDIWTWENSGDHDEEYDWDMYEDSSANAEPGTVTIYIYMNGSNLETESGVATTDILEMIDAGYSENVNILIQTMGTKYWSKELGIKSDRSQTYHVGPDGLELVRDDLGQLDCTKAETLRDFVHYGCEEYPASRNILIFWDHGGGPAYGFGWDEFQDDWENLSVDEMVKALDGCGAHFDFIGMDCCIMSCLEVAYPLRDYCNYMILSEDFESALGWYYTGWLEALYKNPSISTYDLGKIIIDDMVSRNEHDKLRGDRSILSLVDESKIDELWEAWLEFAYNNEEELLSTNYSQDLEETGKGAGLSARFEGRRNKKIFDYLVDEVVDYLLDEYAPDDYYDDEVYVSDYCITDLMGLAHIIDSDESEDLADAVNDVLLYVGATSDNLSLTGISITLPYDNTDLYYELINVLERCDFDDEYIQWLYQFVNSGTDREGIDWDSWGETFWNDWGDYQDSDVWGDWDDDDYCYDDDDYCYDDDIWGEWDEDEDFDLFDIWGDWEDF